MKNRWPRHNVLVSLAVLLTVCFTTCEVYLYAKPAYQGQTKPGLFDPGNEIQVKASLEMFAGPRGDIIDIKAIFKLDSSSIGFIDKHGVSRYYVGPYLLIFAREEPEAP